MENFVIKLMLIQIAQNILKLLLNVFNVSQDTLLWMESVSTLILNNLGV